MDGRRFERSAISPPIVSTVLRQLHPAAENVFKYTYLPNFLELPVDHSEREYFLGWTAFVQLRVREWGHEAEKAQIRREAQGARR